MDLIDVLIVVFKIAAVLVVLLSLCAYTTLLERKVVARFQSRIGPNRAGPQGVLQPLADFVKLAFKEDLTPAGANRLIFTLAPCPVSLIDCFLGSLLESQQSTCTFPSPI